MILAGIMFGAVAVMMFIACLITRKYKRSCFLENEYKFGMGFALWLVDRFRLHVKVGADMWKAMDNVQCHEDVEESLKKHTVKKIYYLIVIVMFMCVVSCILCIKSADNDKKEAVVNRPSPGEGEEYVTKTVIIDDGKKEDITFEVSERQPDEEETHDVMDDAIKYIDENYLGDNKSPDEVSGKLNLMDSVPGSNVNITWITDEEGYISADGTIERIREDEGVVVSICAILEYGDVEERHYIPLRLVKREKDISDKDNLLDAIEEADKQSILKSSFALPENIGGKKVRYVSRSKESIVFIVVLGFISIFTIFYCCDREIMRKNALRKEEMLYDFPEIMSKFCLFLKAGMTVKGAWNLIASDNKKDRYINKEMQITQNEMHNGLTFTEAIERFGIRCDMLQYNKFANWLVQSSKKGTDNLISLIESERFEARAERNKIIMINGEKISQKLLLPMMGLLAVVMALVIIPAFAGL